MYGKISIYLTVFVYVILPIIFIITHMLKNYYEPSREISNLIDSILVVPFFSTLLLIPAIVICGFISKSNNENYGIVLNIGIIAGIITLLLVSIVAYFYMQSGGGHGRSW